MARKLLEVKGHPDICGSLSWSIYPIREFIKKRPPKDSDDARRCREAINDIYDLFDEIGCPYVKTFKAETLKFCRVKR